MMRVVIVGAGYAGVMCALRFARKARGRAQITLINGSSRFVERIRLHERAAGRHAAEHDLVELMSGTDVQLQTGWVNSIDLARHTLSVGGQDVAWDRLVLALGSEFDTSQVPGAREHAFTLEPASLPWFEAALPALARRNAQLVIVGGGLTGIEAATELAEQHPGLRIVLVTRGEVAPECSPSAREHVRATLRGLHVELRERVEVECVRSDELRTVDGRSIPFSACLWAVGFRAPALARDAGLNVNARGQVIVDADLRAQGQDAVYVAGDLASVRDARGVEMPMGCKSALPSGMYVADALARDIDGEPLRPFKYPQVPYCISLGRRDALLQLPRRPGVDAPMFVRGKLAARVKELICRATIWSLNLERLRARLTRTLRWRSTPLLPAPDAPHVADDARV